MTSERVKDVDKEVQEPTSTEDMMDQENLEEIFTEGHNSQPKLR